MLRRIPTRPLASGDDRGIAMIMVMGTITVLGMLLAVTLTYAMAVQPQARRNQDWNAALAAAQAGVDDYVAKLNGNDAYWQTVDCTNPALEGPNAGTNSCGWTSSTPAGWQQVSAANEKAGYFHYDADASTLAQTGSVRLTSTGKVGDSTRTIQVLVRRGGSTDFLYYTDFEDADPANTVVYGTSGPSYNECGRSGPALAKYWWQSSASTGDRRRYGRCTEIQFAPGDVLDGRVHFNDTPLMGGNATFRQGYETADPACPGSPYNVANCKRGSGTPQFGTGYRATYAGVLLLQDNAAAFASYPGCVYTGDTRIRFNSNGTMTVWSTRSSGTAMGTGCGNPSGSWPQTVSVPDNQVIYVKNYSSQSRCSAGQVGDGIPLSNDINRDVPTFYCGYGNAYIEGTVKGRVTVASANNIILTGDLLLEGVTKGATPSGLNLIGLVAANSVVVAHPVRCTTSSCGSYQNLTTINDRYIYASIQTLQHSFWVQSYNRGADLGDLHVYGSIAQKWRGIVGTSGGTGFTKDYNYDTRLRYTSPPYFPQWANAVWSGQTTGEIDPMYS